MSSQELHGKGSSSGNRGRLVNNHQQRTSHRRRGRGRKGKGRGRWFRGRGLFHGRGGNAGETKEVGNIKEITGTSGSKGVKKTSRVEDESLVDQKLIDGISEQDEQSVDDKEDTTLEDEETGMSDNHGEKTVDCTNLEGAADNSLKEVRNKTDTMDLTTQIGDEKNKLLEEMSRQFNSTAIPEGPVPPDPKRGVRVPRLTRKRKSEVLDVVEKTPETVVTQLTSTPLASTYTIQPITNALKKVRKENFENSSTPNVTPNASPNTTPTSGRTRRGIQDRKSAGEKDLVEEPTSVSEFPETESKIEEASNIEKGTPGTRGKKRGRGRGKPLVEDGDAGNDSGTESPICPTKGRGKVRSSSEEDSQNTSTELHTPSITNRGRGRGKGIVDNETSTPVGRGKGRGRGVVKDDSSNDNKGRGKQKGDGEKSDDSVNTSLTPGRGRGRGRIPNEESTSSSHNNSPINGSGRRGRGKVEVDKEGTCEPEVGGRQRRSMTPVTGDTTPQSEPKRSQRLSSSRDGSHDSTSTVKRGKQKTIPEMLKKQETVSITKAYPSRVKKEDMDAGLTKTGKKKKKHFKGLSYSFKKKKKKGKGRMGFGRSGFDNSQETDSVVSEEIDIESIDSSSQDVPSEQLSYVGQDGIEDALSEVADNDTEMENAETPDVDGETEDLEDLNPEEAIANPDQDETNRDLVNPVNVPADEELSNGDDIDEEKTDEVSVNKNTTDEDIIDKESCGYMIKSSETCEVVAGEVKEEASDHVDEEAPLKPVMIKNLGDHASTLLKNFDESRSTIEETAAEDAVPNEISSEGMKVDTYGEAAAAAAKVPDTEIVEEVSVDDESSSAEVLDKEENQSENSNIKVSVELDDPVLSKSSEEVFHQENLDASTEDAVTYGSQYSCDLLSDAAGSVMELEHSATPGAEDMLPEESATVSVEEKGHQENSTEQSRDESQLASVENVTLAGDEVEGASVPPLHDLKVEIAVTSPQEMAVTSPQEGICKTALLTHSNREPLSLNDHGNRHLPVGRRRHSVSKRRLDDLGVEGHNSDSSDSLSEARPPGEGVRKSKRLSRNSSPHPLAIAAPRSPEDAGKNQSKPIGTQSAYVATPSLTNVLCKCRIKENPVAVGVTGDLYCQAIDSFDGRMIGCCNVVTNQRYLRVSGKIPFMLLCDIHRQRLRRHNCCPCCGLFCTQGIFYECTWDKTGMRHYYHKLCGLVLAGTTLCPHCGAEEPPKEVQLELKLNRKPVVYLKQHQERKEASARMTWSKKVLPETEGETELLPENEPTLQLRNGRVISANKLPLGLGREKLQEAILSISDGKTVNVKPSPKGIYWACKQNDLEKLLHVLVQGVNPNVKVKEYGNQTGMHVAAAYGSLAALHVLTLAGATIDMTDTQLMTPLMVGITKEQNSVVHYLIQAGASLMAKTQDGMTCLHLAAKCGNFVSCQHILDSGRLTRHAVNMQDEGGWTPLVWASENRFIDVVKFLLDRGGNPQLCDVEQNTALHWAAFSGSTHICSMVLDRGCSLRSMNAHGDTPLHIAARQNHIDAVVLLLARGARLDVLNAKGQTPADCALPDSDVYRQLTLNSKLIEMMQQNNIRTEKILSSDIAGGKEEVPIPCVNGIDDDILPKDYLYIAENCEASNVIIDRTITSLKWCECEDGCNAEHCGCGQLNFQCWYDPDGRLLPDFNYADPPMIFECNRACRCNKLSCNNRVVQHGISAHMQLFKTTEKGWGVRALKTIQKGSYVCEYVGEIITDLEADQRQDDSYLFDLDNKDSETFCIDARAYGNIARFINHLCEANLTPVKVFIDHQDLTFPRIAFFANRDIEADEELGFDYGEKFWIIKYKHFTCNCASEKCKYSSKTIHTTLENYNKRIRELQEMM